MSKKANEINVMPPLSSNYFNYELYAIDNKRKPTHFSNGVARPASKRQLKRLVDRWNR